MAEFPACLIMHILSPSPPQLLDESEFKAADVVIPTPYLEYTTRYQGGGRNKGEGG